MLDPKKTQWFAVYTRPRFEKKVFERLVEAGIETFLPLQTRLKQWSDRKKLVEEPLIRSYIFVKIVLKEYKTVIETEGIVRFVRFEGQPAPIPEKQINVLKMLLAQQIDMELAEEELNLGDKVEIRIGSMTGFDGILVNHKGKDKAIIQIDHITHALMVTLPKNYIAKAINGDS